MDHTIPATEVETVQHVIGKLLITVLNSVVFTPICKAASPSSEWVSDMNRGNIMREKHVDVQTAPTVLM